MSSKDYIKLPRFLWLWLPLALLIMKIKVELFSSAELRQLLVNENGIYETLQVIVLIIALVIALLTLVKMPKDNKWLVSWIGIAALSCVYVAGEEISWGQHILNWSTPDTWMAYNDQGETNLHNTSSWFDQKPRLILSIGVYVGGIIIPLLLMYKQKWLEQSFLQKFDVLFPTPQFLLLGCICLFIKIADKIGDAAASHLFARNAESEELFLFYFVMVYLFLMKKRLVAKV